MKLDYTPLLDVGEGEPMVLLQGLFGNLSNWSHVVHEFSPSYRILIPRLPFFATPVSAERLDDLVQYVEDFIDALGLKKVILLGNSLGGQMALLYAWRQPARVKKLVLAASSGLSENNFDGTYPRIKDYAFIMDRVYKNFYQREVVTTALVDEVFQAVQSKVKAQSLVGLARAAQRHNLADILDQVVTPTLLVWGLQDNITPPEVALQFHERLPHSSIVFFEHCGHVPMIEQPQLFTKHVRKFLAR